MTKCRIKGKYVRREINRVEPKKNEGVSKILQKPGYCCNCFVKFLEFFWI